MDNHKAKTLTQRYQHGRFVAEIPKMREAEFRRYMAGLSVRLGQFDGGRLGLALTMTVLGLGLTTVLFLAYLLVFVLIPKFPVLPGLIVSLVVGFLIAGVLFALSLSVRNDRRRQDDEIIQDPELIDKLTDTLSPYESDRVLGTLVTDAIHQAEYAERRKAEIGEANERTNSKDATAKKRVAAVTDLEHKAARAHIMESVSKMREYLEKRRSMGLAELELEYESAYAETSYDEAADADGDISQEEEELVRSLRRQGWEWRLRRRLAPISSPLRDNYEFVLAEMDYTLLALELAERGLSAGKDGIALADIGKDKTAGETGQVEALRGEVAEIAERLARERRETFAYDESAELPDMLEGMREPYLQDAKTKTNGKSPKDPQEETAQESQEGASEESQEEDSSE